MESSEIQNNETNFHDNWADSINVKNVCVYETFEACTSPENKFIIRQLGDVSGKKVLEIGCGAGEASVYLAIKGANVTATDISTGMLQVVQQVAQLHNVSLTTMQCFADKLPFEENEFDIVYAANILHHVNIEETIKEVKRVLKNNGEFVCWEPLAHNPVINVYRRIASNVRTADEHPLKISDVRTISTAFDATTLKFTWFFTLYIFLKFFFFDRVDPNKERYWKKIIVDHNKLSPLYNRLEKVDNYILKKIPFLNRYCWNVSFYCRNNKILTNN